MSTTTPNKVRWTVDDLESLPGTSDRFEIIDGDLHVARAPHWKHQSVAGRIYAQLLNWSTQSGLRGTCDGSGDNFFTQ